jgi:hypothetical protein
MELRVIGPRQWSQQGKPKRQSLMDPTAPRHFSSLIENSIHFDDREGSDSRRTDSESEAQEG